MKAVEGDGDQRKSTYRLQKLTIHKCVSEKREETFGGAVCCRDGQEKKLFVKKARKAEIPTMYGF